MMLIFRMQHTFGQIDYKMIHLEAYLLNEHLFRPPSHWMAILLRSAQHGWIASNLENFCNDFTMRYTPALARLSWTAQGVGQVSCLH